MKTKRLIEETAAFIHHSLESRFPEISPEDREDIANEIQLKLWRLILNGKRISRFRSYLGKIIYTTALDILKERSPHLSMDEILKRGEFGSPFFRQISINDQGISPDWKFMIDEAIASLPERKKAVLHLYIEGFSLKEIASRLQWTQPKVRHVLYRAIKELKTRLGKEKDKKNK